ADVVYRSFRCRGPAGREGRLLLSPPGLLSVLWLQALLSALRLRLLRLRPTPSLPLLASGTATGQDRRSETSPVLSLSCASCGIAIIARIKFAATKACDPARRLRKTQAVI